MKKILCIHGIGGKDASMKDWSPKWEEAIAKALNIEKKSLNFDFLEIDKIFDDYAKKNGIKYAKGILKLISDWVSSSLFASSRGMGISENIRWYAGMVVQFVEDKQLRQKLSDVLAKKMIEFKPDLIYSHSLGTLIAYDFLRQQSVNGKLYPCTLITSGSQVGHPALLKTFGGSIEKLSVRHWYNFHNRNDKVFAYESISVDADNFTEIETPFSDGALSINHEALDYILHPNALRDAWPNIPRTIAEARSLNQAPSMQSIKIIRQSIDKEHTQKALLVGINDYPDPENQLNGCVNDVFRMSEVLQEMGFAPDNIKVVLNERATSDNLRRCMDWLLKDARDGDTRVFYYSGHGAQIPALDLQLEDDVKDECLVTYDFDWKRENCYTDKEFLRSYSQLPFGVNFITMLDCCHSGGMTRDGLFRARGLTPPDDIRHRSIKWDIDSKMWVPRDYKLKPKKLFKRATKHEALFIGDEQDIMRFGRGISLWSDINYFEQAKKKYGTKGPYLPLIIQACKEDQYSYEYKHGVTSYGAFTYTLTTLLRQWNDPEIKQKAKPSFTRLVTEAAKQLKELGYQQTPQVTGPRHKIEARIPFLNTGKRKA